MKPLLAGPSIDGPRTPDELHQYIAEVTGNSIPRVSVCSNHEAPFDFASAIYFGTSRNALGIAPRAGAKTWKLGTLAAMRCRFTPNLHAVVAGSIEAQANACYEHVREYLRLDPHEVDTSLRSITRWANGSTLKTLTGSESSVRGPRGQLVLLDELDDWDPRVLSVAMGMRADRYGIESQVIAASTRQHAHGPVAAIEAEVKSDIANGYEPGWDIWQWCLKETMAPVENCGDGCGCDRIAKGKKFDGSVRTFEDICLGRAS
jgi:hypothetical protein